MPLDHKIPHKEPWPRISAQEQKNLQVLTALVNGEELVGQQEGWLRMKLEQEGPPRTPSQAALCFLAEHTNPRFKACEEYFLSQLECGFMAPWGRNQFGEVGIYDQENIATVCAILTTQTLDFHALRWLRGWMALHEATLYNGFCYMPGASATEKKGPLPTLTLATLKTGKWVGGSKQWRWLTKAGYPLAIGAWMVRHLFETEVLSGGLSFTEEDLPPVPLPMHIVRTTEGICNWIVGADKAPKYLHCQPVAGAWGDEEFFYRRPAKKDYSEEWPTEDCPGLELRGTVVSHLRGDLTGWTRL